MRQSWQHPVPPLANIDTVLYSSLATSGNLLTPPDNFRFINVDNIRYSIEIVGRTDAPINASVDASVKAPSAYLHVRMRMPAGTTMAPSDRIAMLAGASNPRPEPGWLL